MTGSESSPAQLRAWSEEVARDPDSIAFLPLAQAYRAQGRRDAALRLCLRGLERHPTHVEAHHLLGHLYRDAGDDVRAFDEWDIALRLDAEHPGARRALGMLAAERGEWAMARRHLDALAAAGPLDAEADAARVAAHAHTGGGVAPAPVDDPLERLRDELERTGRQRGILGALVFDDRGMVLSGSLRVRGEERAAEAAAALGGTAADAEQAVRHLGLGIWRGILLETATVSVRLAPVPDGLLAVVAERDAPPGWVLRLAERTRRMAASLLAGPDAEAGR